PESMHGAVAETNLHLARQGDHELPPRRGVPVDEVAWRRRAELDAFGFLQRAQLRVVLEIHELDVCLPVVARVQACYLHTRRGYEKGGRTCVPLFRAGSPPWSWFSRARGCSPRRGSP